MKKRFIKKILLWSLLVCSIVMFFFKACGDESRLYYLPQAKLYIKLHRGFYNDTVDIYISKNKNGPFDERHDYLKTVGKLPTIIVINTEANNKLILTGDNYGILQVNNNSYKFERTELKMTDTIFCSPQIKSEPEVLKTPYLCISITEYMEGISVKEPGKGYFDKIDECR